MKHDDDKRNKTRRGLTGDYKVGFGKPPKEFKFKPGQSGNVRGRPRGTRKRYSLDEPLSEIVFEEAGKLVPVNENGRQSLISIGRLAVRQAAISAAKGNGRALTVFLKLLSEASVRREERRAELRTTALEYIAAWYAERDRRAQLGDQTLMPRPHPDSVHIDEDGSVWVSGPLREEDTTATWDVLWKAEQGLEVNIAEIQHELAAAPNDDEYVKWLREDLQQSRQLLKTVKRGLSGIGPAR